MDSMESVMQTQLDTVDDMHTTTKIVKTKKAKVAKPKRTPVEKKPRRRRPLKRTAIDKLQLRLIDYNKRLEINRTRVETLEKKVDTIDYEMSCRNEETSDTNTVEQTEI
jgi:hypothetical protein